MAGDKMQLEDWLDDLCVRFIINLPEEDLSSVARICFQIEEAQWFYEDFVRPLDPTLPSMSLRNFSLRIFQHCPLLAPFSVENHTRAFEEFLQYKTRVPVRGAILLNEAMDSTVLVKGWKKGANWSFPRGKINKDEDDLECAIREVYEETGYDLNAAGLVPEKRDVKYIEVTMREQQLRLYVFRDVPMDTYFEPRTRKEISKIEWYRLSELPAFRKKGNQIQNDAAAASNANKFYMVAPFLVPLKKWVVQQKKKDEAKLVQGVPFQPQSLQEEPVTEDDVWTQPPSIPQPAAPEPTRQNLGLDTLEGATKELRRLLKVQPATQSLQVSSPPQSDRDKGASLLALLQAKSQASPQAPPQPLPPPVPHTPHDLTISEIPQPGRPHHQHHPQPRAPMSTHQPPPQFPLAPHQAQHQNWNHPGPQGPQGMPMPGRALGHPQHPQAPFNQVNFPGGPSPANLANQFLGPHPSGMPMPPNINMSPAKPQPKQLTTQSMALLDVFKTGLSKQPADQAQSQPNLPPHNQFNAPSHSNMGHQAVAPLQQTGPQGWQHNNIPERPHPAAATNLGRGQAVTQEHRSALLQMFKKAEPSDTQSSNPPSANPLQPQHSGMRGSPAAFNQNVPPQGSPLNAPGAGPSPLQQYTILKRPLPSQTNSHPTPPGGAAAALFEAAGIDKPTSLASPPSTASLPAPSSGQNKGPPTAEQKQKLLSLFGKPQSVSPGIPGDKGKAPDVAAPYNASPRMGSHAALPEGISELRQQTQTPISPADRNFLLNYLASATGGTK